jgi:signal transduction histidine kinase
MIQQWFAVNRRNAMTHSKEQNEQLAALARHLSSRREAILLAWRDAVEADPQLMSASHLSRSQFNDHIPNVLDAFEAKLCSRDGADQAQASEDQQESAAEHGTHRWQQGYDQSEAMREWAHLQLCLFDELERYEATHADITSSVMSMARRDLAQLCGEGMVESAARYARLQQVEATGRLRDMEQALTQLNELERERALLWREAAHDLRGKLGVLESAAFGLRKEGVPEPMRASFLEMLQKGVNSFRTLLSDLTHLTRLEAGKEVRHVSRFDVATVMKDLCANYQGIATDRGLFLTAEGPASLGVEGDEIKSARIAQNLLVNALMYTQRGGVVVKWDIEHEAQPARWTLCVQDTGPGFDTDRVTPLARELKQATDEAQEIQDNNDAGSGAESSDPAPTLASLSSRRAPGEFSREGIGLSIVKRLCELLDATLELQTSAGEGTTFRVSFPIRY